VEARAGGGGDVQAALARDVQTALARARLLVLDVDGVLTDGRIAYAAGPAGLLEVQVFDVQDGISLRWLQQAGMRIAWITGRGCAVTEHRARELEIDALEMHVVSKRAALTKLQERFGIGVEDTVAMGDDFPDFGLRARAALFVAPANARVEIKAVSDLVTSRAGGDGAVRELAEILLAARGRWQSVIDAAAQ
jgi:3-deoxy-D-manno-octulosonate 8-phosphate phosphatase (KDO 8-P phosphatase)